MTAAEHAGPTTGHVILTEEHAALRASIRSFVDREIVPHVADWEQLTFPNSIVPRMGELGLLGLSVPEEYGGRAATTSPTWCSPKRSPGAAAAGS